MDTGILKIDTGVGWILLVDTGILKIDTGVGWIWGGQYTDYLVISQYVFGTD